MSQHHKARQLLEQGKQSHLKGNLIAAQDAYVAALELDPHLVEAEHFHGLTLLRMGETEAGLLLLRRSIEQAPETASFHYNLGYALKTSDPQAAIASLQEAHRLAPTDHDFAITLAETLLQENRIGDSIAVLERAHALRPQRWENLQGLAELYARSGDAALALQRYEQGVALHAPMAQLCRIDVAALRREANN
jgi:tetratricopeptide (TPR) repeat protein